MKKVGLEIVTRIAITFVLIAAVPVSDAVPVDIRSYGKCVVLSNIDEFEDKILFHMLACDGPTGEWLTVACNEFKNVLSFKPSGSHSASEEWINIRYRFDKHEHITERWFWKNAKQTANSDVGDSQRDIFLYRVASSERLIFGIGSSRSEITFGSDTVDAVKDFKGRCP